MKKIIIKALSLVILMTLLLSSLPATVQAASTAIRLSPRTNGATAGQIFSVDITLEDTSAQSIDGLQIYVNFDHQYLQVVDTAGNPVTSSTVNPIQSGAIITNNLTRVLKNQVNPTYGFADIACGIDPNTPNPVNASGVIATIQFKALKSTRNTLLSFSTSGERNTRASLAGSNIALGLTPIPIAIGAGLTLVPSATTAYTGQVFTVDIRLDATLQPVDGLQAYVNYNMAYLQVVDSSGNPVTSSTANPIQTGAIITNNLTRVLKNRVDTTSGYPDIGYADIACGIDPNTPNPVNSSGVVATIRFKALQAGTTTMNFNIGGERNTLVVLTAADVTGSRTGTSIVINSTPRTNPVITWANPADITYGTALSSTQLNATANVPGTFTYTPATGAILTPGTSQNLHVDFTPNDATTYNTASADVKINVNRKQLTPVFTIDSRPYNGTTAATITGRSLTGIVVINSVPDSVSLTGGTAVFDNKNVGTRTATITGFTLADANAGYYTLPASATATASITKIYLTATAENKTMTAGGTDPVFTIVYSGFVNNETASVLTSPPTAAVSVDHSKAGTYPITISGGTDTNYNFYPVTGLLTVVDKPTFALTAAVSPTGAGNITGNAGRYTAGVPVTLTAKAASGYTFSYWTASGVVLTDTTSNPLTFTMPASAVTITAVFSANVATVTLGNLSQTYTGMPLSASVTTSPSGLAVILTYNGSTNPPTSAGSYAIVATVNDPRYTGSASDTLVINKAALIATAENKEIKVGYTDPAFTIAYSGFVNNETAAVLTTAPTATVSVTHTAVGTYSIVPSGGVATNYSFTYVNGTLTVTNQDVYAVTSSISSGSGSIAGNAGYYIPGATVNLTPVPSTGWTFSGWTVTGVTGLSTSTANPLSFIMPGNAVSVQAAFIQNNYQVTATANPTNGGNISGNLGSYHYGDPVSLTASPASSGWLFSGWVSDDIAISNFTSNPLSFNMPAAPVAISAVFIKITLGVSPVSTSDNPIIVIYVAGNVPKIQFYAFINQVQLDGSTVAQDVTSSTSWSSTAGVIMSGTTPGLAVTQQYPSSLTSKITAHYTDAIKGIDVTADSYVTVMPDKMPPLVTLAYPDDDTQVPYSDNPSIMVSGRISGYAASANVTVNSNSYPVFLTPASEPGTRTFSRSVPLDKPTGNLARKNNAIKVVAADAAGNIGESLMRNVIVSAKIIPVITIDQPAQGYLTNSSSVTVNGTAIVDTTNDSSAYIHQVILVENGSSMQLPLTGNSFSYDIALKPGNNTITVYGYTIDSSGDHTGDANYLGTSGTRTVTYDNVAPVVTITSPSANAITGKTTTTVTGTIDDPTIKSVDLYINQGTSKEQKWTSAGNNPVTVTAGQFSQTGINLSTGSNSIVVNATDAALNTGSASINITYQQNNANIDFNSQLIGMTTNSTTLTIFGVITSNTDLAKLLVYPVINGARFPSYLPKVTTDTSGNFFNTATGSFNFSVTNLTNGLNTIKVLAYKNNTNNLIGSSSTTITLDTTKPVLTLDMTDPSDKVTITVSSSKSLSGIPSVSVNGTTVDMTQTQGLEWAGSYAVPGDGEYPVTATGTDLAGNISIPATASFRKTSITISSGNDQTISTGSGSSAAAVTFGTSANTTAAGAVSFTQTSISPAGDNVQRDESASMDAGVYFNINADPQLRDVLDKIIIKFHFNPLDYTNRNIDYTTLEIYLWDVTQGAWLGYNSENGKGGIAQDADGYYVWARLDHLSQYGIFGNTIYYSLTVNKVGNGTVTQDPAPGSQGYPANTPVQLTAIPDTGWIFGSWSGVDSSNGNVANVAVSSNRTVTATFTQQSSGNNNGGGGGGGGGGGTTTTSVTTGGDLMPVSLEMDSSGTLTNAARIQTKDNSVVFDLASGTKMLASDNTPLASLTVAALASPPAAPSNNTLVAAYTFGPDGAKFIPYITLTLKYDPAKLPAGIAEKDLYIAYFDGKQWQSVKSNPDPSTRTVTAQITHFSSWALLGKAAAAPTSAPPTSAPPTSAPPTSAPPTSSPPSSVPPTSAPPTSPSTTAPVTTPPPPSPSLPLGLILGIIGALIVVVVIVLMVRRRKE